jgi:hypothetical protein
MIKELSKTEKIIEDIISGKDIYFSYSHFHASNMADYTLMHSTIEDMTTVYDINEVEAAEIISQLTH